MLREVERKPKRFITFSRLLYFNASDVLRIFFYFSKYTVSFVCSFVQSVNNDDIDGKTTVSDIQVGLILSVDCVEIHVDYNFQPIMIAQSTCSHYYLLLRFLASLLVVHRGTAYVYFHKMFFF